MASAAEPAARRPSIVIRWPPPLAGWRRRAGDRCTCSRASAAPGARTRAALIALAPGVLVVLPTLLFVGVGVVTRAAVRPGRRGRPAPAGAGSSAGGRDAVRRGLLGQHARQAVARVGVLACLRGQPDRPPSCLPAGHTPPDAAVLPARARRLGSVRSAHGDAAGPLRCGAPGGRPGAERGAPAERRRGRPSEPARLLAAGLRSQRHPVRGAAARRGLAAGAGPADAAGALLGLACATKQLAWPFAPFLLLHASGARSLGESLRGDAWARMRRPLAAAALVFLAVVVPVAALDPRAFYADIVAYNMGLGGDAYPFGGTPGFGFANLVLYAGGVRSLRDGFPFAAVPAPARPAGARSSRARSCGAAASVRRSPPAASRCCSSCTSRASRTRTT